MPYGLHTRASGHDISLALMASSPNAQACVAGFLAPQSAMSVPEAWVDVYRRAYEQARASLEPSRFQVMLEPRWN
jgi:hypothetical protein